MRGLVIAVLVFFTVLDGATRADELGDAWVGTHWGESPEALQRHFGARGFALPQPIDFGDSYAPLVVRNVSVGGVGLIAYYQIDKARHGLKRIQLERPRHQVSASAFHTVLMALDGDYGAPNNDCGTLPGPTTAFKGTAEYVWQRDGAVIRAIFHDTALDVLNRCASPACGLSAQLLVRISPPAEDSGLCPPLPSGAQLRAPG